jgi:hypothetical protein
LFASLLSSLCFSLCQTGQAGRQGFLSRFLSFWFQILYNLESVVLIGSITQYPYMRLFDQDQDGWISEGHGKQDNTLPLSVLHENDQGVNPHTWYKHLSLSVWLGSCCLSGTNLSNLFAQLLSLYD